MENKPIPCIEDATWESVYSMPIADCEEPLIPLSFAPERFLVRSHYFELGMPGALAECHARTEVQQRLLKASDVLPDHLRLVVLDAWRSEQLQRYLFEQCQAVLADVYVEANIEELFILTQQYVAEPTPNALTPSPHLTGGAVDLMIATRDGVPLFFGSPFDDPDEISHARYFEEKEERGEILSELEKTALYNRRLLYNVMIRAGFVNIGSEWWHFEYGTQRWACKTGQKNAKYGGVAVARHPFTEMGRKSL